MGGLPQKRAVGGGGPLCLLRLFQEKNKERERKRARAPSLRPLISPALPLAAAPIFTATQRWRGRAAGGKERKGRDWVRGGQGELAPFKKSSLTSSPFARRFGVVVGCCCCCCCLTVCLCLTVCQSSSSRHRRVPLFFRSKSVISEMGNFVGGGGGKHLIGKGVLSFFLFKKENDSGGRCGGREGKRRAPSSSSSSSPFFSVVHLSLSPLSLFLSLSLSLSIYLFLPG